MSLGIAVFRRLMRFGSLVMSLFGLYAFTWADFRSDTTLMVLFVAMPLLSFPASLVFYRRAKGAAIAHCLLAIGYLTAYTMLDWRTCSAAGYCLGVMHTVGITMTVWRVQGMMVVALAAIVLAWLQGRGEQKAA